LTASLAFAILEDIKEIEMATTQKKLLKVYTVTMEDGSDFEVCGRDNQHARQKAVDYLRFMCGYMSQDAKPKFSVREKREYLDSSLASTQARYRRENFRASR
jgi:hypothetical protein